MTLRDRLARQREGQRPEGAGSAAARPRMPEPGRPDLARWVPGWDHAGPSGTCFVGERSFPAGDRHGHYRIGAIRRAAPHLFGLLAGDPRLDGIDLRRAAFLDTETTGLAGGTGTFAFLVGVGYFEEGADVAADRFIIRQYAMRDPAEEAALLDALAELLGRFDAIVTFNGRAFDWPLIETRYRLNRRAVPLRDPLHLDLLFPARRVWRHRLESCALKDLEAAVLGVGRSGDVPGWLIPGLYFQFQRDRDPRPLVPVFDHNLLDILSLATLGARLAAVVADPSRIDPGDSFGAGRLHEARGQIDRAMACYEAALAADLPDLLRRRCARHLSTLYKRARRWTEAVALWEKCCEDTTDRELFGHLELAKYYEHVARDPRQAARVVERAALLIEVTAIGGASDRVQRAEWDHRRRRLMLKLGRTP